MSIFRLAAPRAVIRLFDIASRFLLAIAVGALLVRRIFARYSPPSRHRRNSAGVAPKPHWVTPQSDTHDPGGASGLYSRHTVRGAQERAGMTRAPRRSRSASGAVVVSGSDTCNLPDGTGQGGDRREGLRLAIKLLDAVIELRPKHRSLEPARHAAFPAKGLRSSADRIREVLGAPAAPFRRRRPGSPHRPGFGNDKRARSLSPGAGDLSPPRASRQSRRALARRSKAATSDPGPSRARARISSVAVR